MKRIAIKVLSVLVFAATTSAGEIGVIREFSQLRPALNRIKIEIEGLYDFNRNGVRDISVVRNGILYVYDPVSQMLLWQFETGPNDSVFLRGFVPFGDITYSILSMEVEDTDEVRIINTANNMTAYNDAGRVVGILQLPGRGPVVLSYVEQDNIYRVIGEVNGNSSASTVSNDFQQRVFDRLGDYRLDLKFQADPGLRLAYDPDLFDPRGDTDLDGDGHLDIPMLAADSSGVSGMVVRGGDSLEVLWQFPFPEEHKANILKGFHGFVDANGDGEKEAILGDNLAVTLDGTVHTIAENFQILDVNNVDGDSLEDIIGLNTVDSTIVVYGLANPTSVSDYDPAEIHFRLFQNYPNPFNPSTTISFTLQISGFTTLKIYDVLGREVATLVNENLEAGVHHQRMLDASKLSSGVYYYALQSGGKREIKKMLMVK